MHGKHVANADGRRRFLVGAVVVLACVAIASAGLTFAWYTGSSSILNPFTKGAVGVDVVEEFDPAAGKKNVAVSVPANDAHVPAYVRAQVDVYWQDAQGVRMWEAPVEKGSADAADPQGYDYVMTWCAFGQAGTANTWVVGSDGLYYWTSPVASSASTDPLIVSCTQNVRYDDGRVLVVDIATQAMQADPARAFNESWGPHAGLSATDDGLLMAQAAAQGGDAA